MVGKLDVRRVSEVGKNVGIGVMGARERGGRVGLRVGIRVGILDGRGVGRRVGLGVVCTGSGVYSIAMGDGVNIVGLGVLSIGLGVGSAKHVFVTKSVAL